MSLRDQHWRQQREIDEVNGDVAVADRGYEDKENDKAVEDDVSGSTERVVGGFSFSWRTLKVMLTLLMLTLTPLKVVLTLVELEGAWSSPPLALAPFPFPFHVRIEIGGGGGCRRL